MAPQVSVAAVKKTERYLVGADQSGLTLFGLRLQFLFLLHTIVVLGLQRQKPVLDVPQPLLGGVQDALRLRQILLSDP